VLICLSEAIVIVCVLSLFLAQEFSGELSSAQDEYRKGLETDLASVQADLASAQQQCAEARKRYRDAEFFRASVVREQGRMEAFEPEPGSWGDTYLQALNESVKQQDQWMTDARASAQAAGENLVLAQVKIDSIQSQMQGLDAAAQQQDASSQRSPFEPPQVVSVSSPSRGSKRPASLEPALLPLPEEFFLCFPEESLNPDQAD
jgi:chromosome segregation ATPase